MWLLLQDHKRTLLLVALVALVVSLPFLSRQQVLRSQFSDPNSNTCVQTFTRDQIVPSNLECSEGIIIETGECTSDECVCYSPAATACTCPDGASGQCDGQGNCVCLGACCSPDGTVHQTFVTQAECDGGTSWSPEPNGALCAGSDAVCGDGTEEGSEECDDGNTQNNDGCSSSCKNEFCGDGIVQSNEECEGDFFEGACEECACVGKFEADPEKPGTCRKQCLNGEYVEGVCKCDEGYEFDSEKAECIKIECGNGIPQEGEGCDDGNTDESDGCTNTCTRCATSGGTCSDLPCCPVLEHVDQQTGEVCFSSGVQCNLDADPPSCGLSCAALRDDCGYDIDCGGTSGGDGSGGGVSGGIGGDGSGGGSGGGTTGGTDGGGGDSGDSGDDGGGGGSSAASTSSGCMRTDPDCSSVCRTRYDRCSNTNCPLQFPDNFFARSQCRAACYRSYESCLRACPKVPQPCPSSSSGNNGGDGGTGTNSFGSFSSGSSDFSFSLSSQSSDGVVCGACAACGNDNTCSGIQFICVGPGEELTCDIVSNVCSDDVECGQGDTGGTGGVGDTGDYSGYCCENDTCTLSGNCKNPIRNLETCQQVCGFSSSSVSSVSSLTASSKATSTAESSSSSSASTGSFSSSSNLSADAHYICQDLACVMVLGPGNSTCSSDQDCTVSVSSSSVNESNASTSMASVDSLGSSINSSVYQATSASALALSSSKSVNSTSSVGTVTTSSSFSIGPIIGLSSISGREELAPETPTLVTSPESVSSSSQGLVAAAAVCGDGSLETGEECDDGNRRNNDGCSESCLLEVGICGDGKVQSLLNEQCESTSDLPSSIRCVNCRFVSITCGDGKVDAGEECDNGSENSNQPDASCRQDCSLARCGDGILDSVELCDDGNARNGDGCDRFCVTESGAEEALVLSENEQQSQQPPTSQPTQVLSGFNQGYPNLPNYGQLPSQLPLAQLQPLIQQQGPVGDTGPAAVAVIGAGAASGVAYMRRKRRK